METGEITAKATDLLKPILGAGHAGNLISAVLELESLASVRELRPTLTTGDYVLSPMGKGSFSRG